jgi:hypothetical protein
MNLDYILIFYINIIIVQFFIYNIFFIEHNADLSDKALTGVGPSIASNNQEFNKDISDIFIIIII